MTIEQKKITNGILIILATLLVLIVGTIIISLNKGFDFTDEGGFLLSYRNVDIYRGGIYNYHIIINKLTNWLNPGIIAYRWMSILITIFSSIILTGGFYKWLNANFKGDNLFKNFFFLFCFISIGNFLFFFPGLRTIYNNTLTNLFLQVSTGLILYLFSSEASNLKSKKNVFILIIIGVLCAFSFFVKFPTGILQVTIYLIIFFLYLKKQRLKEKFILFFTLCVGTAMGIVLYFIFFQDLNEWYFNFRKEYNMLSDHSSNILLKAYVFEVLSLIKFSFKHFSWLLIFPIIILIKKYFILKYNSKKNKFLWVLFLFLSIALLSYQFYYFEFYRSTFANSKWINAYFYIILIAFQISLLLTFGLTTKMLTKDSFKNKSNEILIIFLLIITPFIGALGTANPIFLNSLGHSATWFGVIVILSFYLSNYVNRNLVISIFIIIPSLVTTLQIVDGNLYVPYYSVFNQNKSNFFQQNEQIKNIHLLDGIYVDVKTKEFLIELNYVLNENNYRKGYPIFGFHIPGVIYLLEGTSPGVPYYFNKARDSRAFESFEHENNPPIIMVTKENPINDELLNIMENKGINFPDAYLLKGEVYFPNTNSLLKVYFPQNYKF